MGSASHRSPFLKNLLFYLLIAFISLFNFSDTLAAFTFGELLNFQQSFTLSNILLNVTSNL